MNKASGGNYAKLCERTQFPGSPALTVSVPLWNRRRGRRQNMERKKELMNEKNLKVLAAEIRLETLKVIHSRGFGHVGGSMDLADLMAVLYGEVMKFDPKNPRWEDRDRFVLSKGHTAPGLYAALAHRGFFPVEDLPTLRHIDSYLQGHPNMNSIPWRRRIP